MAEGASVGSWEGLAERDKVAVADEPPVRWLIVAANFVAVAFDRERDEKERVTESAHVWEAVVPTEPESLASGVLERLGCFGSERVAFAVRLGVKLGAPPTGYWHLSPHARGTHTHEQ